MIWFTYLCRHIDGGSNIASLLVSFFVASSLSQIKHKNMLFKSLCIQAVIHEVQRIANTVPLSVF